MAGMMGMGKSGKASGKAAPAEAEAVEPEAETEPTFNDAFTAFYDAMKSGDKAEAAAAFRACCMTSEE